MHLGGDLRACGVQHNLARKARAEGDGPLHERPCRCACAVARESARKQSAGLCDVRNVEPSERGGCEASGVQRRAGAGLGHVGPLIADVALGRLFAVHRQHPRVLVAPAAREGHGGYFVRSPDLRFRQNRRPRACGARGSHLREAFACRGGACGVRRGVQGVFHRAAQRCAP